MIAAGTFRHQVQIQSPTYAQNAAGEQVATWTTVATLRAEVEPTGGSEVVASGETTALTNFTVRHRYYVGLSTQFRYLWVQAQGNLTLNIVSLKQDRTKSEHTAACIQRDNLS